MDLTFLKDGAVVKTIVVDVSHVYLTIIGVASTNAGTADAQNVEYVGDAVYLYAVKTIGVPAGEFTVDVTVTVSHKKRLGNGHDGNAGRICF